MWHVLGDFRQNRGAMGAAWSLEFVVLYLATLTAYHALMTGVYARVGSPVLAVLMHAGNTGWQLVLFLCREGSESDLDGATGPAAWGRLRRLAGRHRGQRNLPARAARGGLPDDGHRWRPMGWQPDWPSRACGSREMRPACGSNGSAPVVGRRRRSKRIRRPCVPCTAARGGLLRAHARNVSQQLHGRAESDTSGLPLGPVERSSGVLFESRPP